MPSRRKKSPTNYSASVKLQEFHMMTRSKRAKAGKEVAASVLVEFIDSQEVSGKVEQNSLPSTPHHSYACVLDAIYAPACLTAKEPIASAVVTVDSALEPAPSKERDDCLEVDLFSIGMPNAHLTLFPKIDRRSPMLLDEDDGVSSWCQDRAVVAES